MDGCALKRNPIDFSTPATALQVIHDEGLWGKLTDKVIVLTGTTSGIGLETARALRATGATLFLTARDRSKAEEALREVLEPGRVILIDMDNGSFSSIRAAATQILDQAGGSINIFIGNAGIMGVPEREVTEDGHERHFAVNHLSHFLLFQLLKGGLLAGSTPEFNSRVVLVSSSAHRSSRLLPSDNYSFERGGYRPEIAYANSKLANIYTASYIERRYGARGLHATSVHPGGIMTKIARYTDPKWVAALLENPILSPTFKSCEQGAATTVVAAVGKEWEGRGGKYLEDCVEAVRGEEDGEMFGTGWVSWTYDAGEEERLWKDSVRMVGVGEEESV